MPDKFITATVSSTGTSLSLSLLDGSFKERRYERPPDEHPIFHLVGRVAAEWARLEYSLDRLIWSLSYTLSPRTACITGQLMGTTPRCRAIMAQLTLRAVKAPEFGRYVSRVNKLMTSAYDPQDRRNRIIHDPWLIDTIHDEPAQFRTPQKKFQYGIKDVDKANIEKTIEDIKSLTKRAEELFAEINADIAASQQKQP